MEYDIALQDGKYYVFHNEEHEGSDGEVGITSVIVSEHSTLGEAEQKIADLEANNV